MAFSNLWYTNKSLSGQLSSTVFLVSAQGVFRTDENNGPLVRR